MNRQAIVLPAYADEANATYDNCVRAMQEHGTPFGKDGSSS